MITEKLLLRSLDALDALEAMKAEFRALDLPYGSTAYTQGNEVCHELRAAQAEQPAEQGPKRDLMWSTVAMQKRHDELQKQVTEIGQLGMVLREQRDELLAALHRANSLLAELSFSSWIPGSDAASVDMRQRILNTHQSVFTAIAKVEGEQT